MALKKKAEVDCTVECAALKKELAALKKELAALKKELKAKSSGGADSRIDIIIDILAKTGHRKRLESLKLI